MTADVVGYQRLRSMDDMTSQFSYSSHPKALYYDSYKNLTDAAKPLHGNIMYDKRVIRGNTWALRRMASEALTKQSLEERKHMQDRRRAIRQRLQSKLNDQQKREQKLRNMANGESDTASLSTISGYNGSMNRLGAPRNIASPPFLAMGSPPQATRRSSVIQELEDEEAYMDISPKAPGIWSSGDSGIAVGGAASVRSLLAEEAGEQETEKEDSQEEGLVIHNDEQAEQPDALKGITGPIDLAADESAKINVPEKEEEEEDIRNHETNQPGQATKSNGLLDIATEEPGYHENVAASKLTQDIPSDDAENWDLIFDIKNESEFLVNALLVISLNHVVSLEQLDQQPPRNTVPFDVSKAVVQELLEAAVQRIDSLVRVENREGVSSLSHDLVRDLLTSAMERVDGLTGPKEFMSVSHAIIDDLLESSVQNVVELSLQNAVEELNVQDDYSRALVREAELKQQLEWEREKNDEFLQELAVAKSELENVVLAKEDANEEFEKEMHQIANLELETVKEELRRMHMEKDRLIAELQFVADERDRYAAKSVAQETLNFLIGECIERLNENYFTMELHDVVQENVHMQNMELSSYSEEYKSDVSDVVNTLVAEKQIVYDLSNEFEPWLLGRVYADVTKQMTNMWLRDATGARSSYCRRSAQRPLRRLLSEIDQLHHQL